MFCFVVMDWTTTTEFDIHEIRHVDKQNQERKRSVKKTLGSWNMEQPVSSVAKEKEQVSFLWNAA